MTRYELQPFNTYDPVLLCPTAMLSTVKLLRRSEVLTPFIHTESIAVESQSVQVICLNRLRNDGLSTGNCLCVRDGSHYDACPGHNIWGALRLKLSRGGNRIHFES